jgi:mutator protein MutT
MKTVEVAIALFLHRDDLGKITLWGQPRMTNDSLLGTWEFPGGKIGVGEKPSEAAQREVLEEVQLTEEQRKAVISVRYNLFSTEIEHYPLDQRTVVLHIFLAKVHPEMLPMAGWQDLGKYTDGSLKLPAANAKFFPKLISYLEKNPHFWSMDWDL